MSTSTSTVQVTLPDGSKRDMPAGSSARQVAESIGPGLARAALAAKVNGEIWDLFCLDPQSTTVQAVDSTREEVALAERFSREESGSG